MIKQENHFFFFFLYKADTNDHTYGPLSDNSVELKPIHQYPLTSYVGFLEILASTYCPGPYGPGPGPFGPGPFIIICFRTIFEMLIAPGVCLLYCSWSSMLFKYGPGAYLT